MECERKGVSFSEVLNRQVDWERGLKTAQQLGEVTPREMNGEAEIDWYIDDVLVAGEPALLVGPEKSLKSSVALAMCLALATPTAFLGHFKVRRRLRVAFFNGELNRHTIERKAWLMAKLPANCVDLGFLEGWFWYYPKLPCLSDGTVLAGLGSLLRQRRPEVAVFDPLYLALGGQGRRVQSANRHAMGPLFRAIADTCLEAGATPVLVDHTVRHRPHKPLGLDDMAWAGPAEFARQWITLNHRRRYEAATGTSRLYLAIGGSAGQGSTWEVDVSEGSLTASRDGRKWEVLSVVPHAKRGTNGAPRDDTAKALAGSDGGRDAGGGTNGAPRDDAAKVCAAIERLAGTSDVAPGYERVRKEAGLPVRRMRAVVADLERQGTVRRVPTQVHFGQGRTKGGKGLVLCAGSQRGGRETRSVEANGN
jgi:hypothetical protein